MIIYLRIRGLTFFTCLSSEHFIQVCFCSCWVSQQWSLKSDSHLQQQESDSSDWQRETRHYGFELINVFDMSRQCWRVNFLKSNKDLDRSTDVSLWPPHSDQWWTPPVTPLTTGLNEMLISLEVILWMVQVSGALCELVFLQYDMIYCPL